MKKVLFFFILTIPILFGCISSTEVDDRDKQKEYFKNRFNVELTDNVEEVKIKDHFIRDSWILFIRFSYNETIFNKIIQNNFSVPKDSLSEETIENAHNDVFGNFGSKPEWFSKPQGENMVYYGRGPDLKKGNWDVASEAIWVDENKKFIYYVCSATDY